ncbi:MAG: hypothetical protein VR64_21010 [Desulfatitalea sp. BRH_c12]|nr:MAG: hypothetical protein VR64_21010 [Desulfatitalea sp. BRH_c12]
MTANHSDRENQPVPNLAAIIFILIALVTVTACVTTSQEIRIPPDATNRMMAENRQMKKRLLLIERENDILKQENLQYRLKTKQLSANIQKLNTDLDTLNEKYQNDTALNEEQIRNLEQKYSLLENDSALKISELSFLVTDLEMKRAQEIKALNELIASQNNAFSKQLDDFKQQSAQREFELSSALNATKKTLDAKELEVSTLRAANSEIAVQLTALTEQLAQSQFARDQIERELKSMKAATEVSFQKLKGGPGQLLLNTR